MHECDSETAEVGVQQQQRLPAETVESSKATTFELARLAVLSQRHLSDRCTASAKVNTGENHSEGPRCSG